MKYIFVLITLMGSMLMGQFEKGNISAGSLFSYSSSKSSSDDDGTGVLTIGREITYSGSIKPAVSYFLMDNLSLDALISMTKMSQDDYYNSMNLLGAGATYYINTMYAGGGFAMSSSTNGQDGEADYKSKSNFLELHGGYLHGLSDNIFLDIGASYLMGMGENTSEYDGDEYKSDNESTSIWIGVGVKAFFSL